MSEEQCDDELSTCGYCSCATHYCDLVPSHDGPHSRTETYDRETNDMLPRDLHARVTVTWTRLERA